MTSSTFSKIEAGKLQIDVQPVDLRGIIEGSLEVLSSRAASKKLELVALISPLLPRFVRTDGGRLRQVLLNLLSNAVKFSGNGEVMLSTSVVSEEESSAVIKIEVIDHGVGMTQECMAGLFQPFVQADASTTRKFGGTGLGLAISKQIVELMGGEIGVSSQVGIGSTFWLTLPLQKQIPGVIKPAARASIFKGIRALVIDPIVANRRLVSDYATEWGMSCDQAASLEDGVRLIQHSEKNGQPFQLVFADAQLAPDGFASTVGQIRKATASVNSALVLMTPLNQRISAAEPGALGRVTVLKKPIRIGELRLAVADAMQLQAPSNTMPPHDGPELPVEAVPEPGAAISDYRVLVAEDNAVNQQVIRKQLQRFGLEPKIAKNGREAVEMTANSEFNLIFMDCQMPEMDGYEAAQTIRARASAQPIWIIALTADAMEGVREKCLAAGMDDYLTKPTRFSDMAAALGRVKLPERVAPGMTG